MNRRFVSIYCPQLSNSKKLKAICLWCKCYTPLTALDEPDAILLDITGCAHLFGSERKMLESMVSHLGQFNAQVAIGPTPKSAKALALFKPNSIIFRQDLPYALYLLPIEAMGLHENNVVVLQQLGIKNIRELMHLPRTQLFKRFGQSILDQIDEMLGAKSDPIITLPEAAQWSLERHLMDTIRDTDYLCTAVELMLSELCAQLQQKGLGIVQLTLTFVHVDRKKSSIHIGASKPMHHVKKLMHLIKLKLDQFNAGLGIETIFLNATKTALFSHHQICLEHDEENNEYDLSFLLDTLMNRLGNTQVFRLMLNESHIPEHRVKTITLSTFGSNSPFEKGGPRGISSTKGELRPVRLFAEPEPIDVIAMLPDAPPKRIIWRKKHILHIAKADGPERIESEWWRSENQEARDYYCIEDTRGLRLWVFKQGLSPKWYLHGIFA